MTVVHHNAGEQGWVVCDDAIDPKGDQFFSDASLFTVQATTVSKHPSSRAAMTSAISWRQSGHMRIPQPIQIWRTPSCRAKSYTPGSSKQVVSRSKCASRESVASSRPGVNLRSR